MDASWLDRIPGVLRRSRTTQELITRGIGEEFIDLPQATVRVRAEGQGRLTVVFVADPPNVIEHYDTLFELLSPWARVVCLETPGFGFSIPKRAFTLTLPEYAQTVVDLLTALKADACVLAFSCVSAYKALRVAADYAVLVSHLLLMQAPVWSEQVKWSRLVDRKGVIATFYVGLPFMAWRKRWVIRPWYRAALPKITPVAPFVEPARKAFEGGASFSLASLFQRWFSAKEPSFAPVTQPSALGDERSLASSDKQKIDPRICSGGDRNGAGRHWTLPRT